MEFLIKKLLCEEVETAAKLAQEVYGQMQEKQWFAPDSEECIKALFQEKKGLFYQAAEVEKQLMAGVLFVLFPGRSPDNLGREIKLPEEELLQVAHMDTVAILPAYRGNGLQYQLMQRAEQELRRRGFSYLMCTVHPDNRFSRENLLKQGYKAVGSGLKYGGLPREILLKDIK